MTRRNFATEARRHREISFKSCAILCASVPLWLTLPPLASAATHVTGTYDLGANPRIMTTVGGTAEYGLVFAQRNKAVTYGGVEYGPGVVKGYLNVSGQLNDGAGNLWLDLIPNLTATPADSYYVVTINIQGRVHAEIWVVPDVASVAVETVRQVQPPGATGSPMDLANATGLLALAHGGTNQSSWTAARCVRVNNLGNALESAAGDCGTGGGSAPIASSTVSGTVKTDTTVGDPVVYLNTTSDTLLAGKASSVHTHSQNDVTNLTTDLAGKVPTTRNVGTSSPLAGGGALSSDLTLSCPTCEVTGNKNAASGYAGLSASSKITASQMQEVLSAADLATYSGVSGNGSTALAATMTALATNDLLEWNGSNWVNSASAAKADALTNDPSDCGANNFATAIAASGNLTCAQPSTSNLSDGSNVVKNNQANTYSGGGLQDLSANKLALPAATTLPASCTANKEIYVDTDAAPAGQQVYLCNSAGNGWNLVGDGGGGGGITTLNTLTATTQTFATPGTTGTAPNWSSVTSTHTLHIPLATTASVTAGLISKTEFDIFNGKPNLVTTGTAGNGPSKVGDATTAARSNHDHRSIHQLSWFFPGTPATGVQNMTLTFPEVAVNYSILDMRVTVNTTSASSSTFNIQRCTASCTGTSPTFANIYSANLTLSASTRTTTKAAAPDQNVASLVAGDQFKANLVTIGASLADVTVSMTVKYDTTN